MPKSLTIHQSVSGADLVIQAAHIYSFEKIFREYDSMQQKKTQCNDQLQNKKEGINIVKQWRFEVYNRPGFSDVHGNSVLEDIKELGISSVEAVQSAKVFLIEADFEDDFAKRVGRQLLADPVCEQYYIGRSGPPAGLAKVRVYIANVF